MTQMATPYEPNPFTRIITEQDFLWNQIERSEWPLFNEQRVYYTYNPYSLRFLEPNIPNMIRIMTFVYFDIFLGNHQLVDAALKIEYQVNASTIGNLEAELQGIALDTHQRFLRIFEVRLAEGSIPSIFRPTYDPEAALLKIESLLQTGVGF